MKPIKVILFLLIAITSSYAQDTVIKLSPEMFIGIQEIQLAQLDGWKFKPGNNMNWAKNETDISGWQTLNPTQLTREMANKDGRVEGWFKLKVKLDKSFGNEQLGIRFFCWAAIDLYIDGKYIRSLGNTGANYRPYREFRPGERLPIPVDMKGGHEYVIAFHFVDEVVTYPGYGLKSNNTRLDQFVKLTGPKYRTTFSKYLEQQPIFYCISMSIGIMLFFLFLLLALQNKHEKFLWLIVLFMALVCLSSLFTYFTYGHKLDYYWYVWADQFENIIGSMRFLVIPIILTNIFKRKVSWDLKCYLFLNAFAFCLGLIPFYQDLFYFATGIGCSIYYLISVRDTLRNAPLKVILAAVFKSLRVFLLMTIVFMPLVYLYQAIVPVLMIIILLLISVYLVLTSWKNASGAQWAIIAGLLLTFLWLVTGLLMRIHYQTTIFPFSRFIYFAIVMSFPLSLLVYVALRFKEILREVVALSEEKNQILSTQNERLELEVATRTSELNQSMQDLKATQSQLIQSEKMASLGELTAGIAHEIQNPLNFVNNFSDVSNELIGEIKEERNKAQETRDEALIDEILQDIEQNLEKINHHGKRADAIVKGMLQHSRTSSGQKEPTDINALADEYLRLAYHGLRAKDKSFNAELITDFDEALPQVNAVPQDMGRVLLNLITNAFYATQKRKEADESFKPVVEVKTAAIGKSVEISVKDNGTGIPRAIVDKIFQPFFTTKPTGEGTGLGLSLAYDIVKAHGGELKVETKIGEGTQFIIQLPVK